jgi:predicted DNA-binding protein YlxM (UPF0122 family)
MPGVLGRYLVCSPSSKVSPKNKTRRPYNWTKSSHMQKDTMRIIDDLELILNINRSCFKVLTQRQLIYLYHRTRHPEIHYMTLQELANEFGCSRQAVDQLWRRGLKRLGTLEDIQKKWKRTSRG